MKSQIAGICATINEKIDEEDKSLEILQDEVRDIEEAYTASKHRLVEDQGGIRKRIHEYQITVKTLQDL